MTNFETAFTEKQFAKLAALANSTSNAMAITNIEGVLEWCNTSFMKMFNWKPKKSGENNLYEVFQAVGTTQFNLASFIDVLEVKNQLLEEVSIVLDENRARCFEVEIITIEKEPSSLALTLVEITKRKSAENELQHAYQDLKETEKQFKKNIQKQNGNEPLYSKDEVATMLDDEKRKRNALEKALIKLRVTQNQLVQSEKMASLGQLTAGISHEINNAINFVYAGIDTLEVLMGEILELLNHYEHLDNGKQLKAKLEKIKAYKKQHDFEGVIDDLNSMIADIKEGALRTTAIVKSLHSFSRNEQAELKAFVLHEGINTVLTLLRQKLIAGDIQIIKNYGKLPAIVCNVAQLNQVFMNVLTNAIQTLQEKKSIYPKFNPLINITSQVDSQQNQLLVFIKDNGMGISDAVQKDVFNPFFTTKEVGEGVGLGLSICYQIIKEYQGDITITSQQEIGTTVQISLPIK